MSLPICRPFSEITGLLWLALTDSSSPSCSRILVKSINFLKAMSSRSTVCSISFPSTEYLVQVTGVHVTTPSFH